MLKYDKHNASRFHFLSAFSSHLWIGIKGDANSIRDLKQAVTPWVAAQTTATLNDLRRPKVEEVSSILTVAAVHGGLTVLYDTFVQSHLQLAVLIY